MADETLRVDEDGYRPNVGIVLLNADDRVFWARRIKHDGWQFPQGGVHGDESVEQALFRELYEELGLRAEHVQVIGRTQGWLRYDLPEQYRGRGRGRQVRGQKQVWFLLRLIGRESDIRLDAGARPEFDDWRWVDYWSPLRRVVGFKRQVYRRALAELAPLVFRR